LSIFDKFLTKIAYPALADMGFWKKMSKFWVRILVPNFENIFQILNLTGSFASRF
jgi:hypothetical protein